MKILIASDWYLPVINGVVTSVVNLKNELTQKGHEVKVLTLSNTMSSHKTEDVYFIKSLNMGKVYPQARASLPVHTRYLNEILKWKPDVVHTQAEFTTYALAKKISSALRIPHIHTYHTIYEDYTHYFSPSKTVGKKTVAIFSKNVLKCVDTVITPTDKVKAILEGYGVKNKIVSVATGIDLKKFYKQYDEEAKNHLKDELGIPKDSKILLYVGRLAKEKNVSLTLEYINKIKLENTFFIIVGGGPYQMELQNEAKALGLSEKVIFTGMIDPNMLPLYYKIGDIFISSSNSETQGLTYIEAIASGLPCLCKKDPVIDEVVLNNVNGYQFEEFEDFKNYFKTMLQNQTLLNDMSKKSVEISRQFSTEIFAREVERVYRDAFAIREKKNNLQKRMSALLPDYFKFKG